MAKHPQLETLISQIDQLLYAAFVVIYILDANLLGLILRCVAQTQYTQPKTHHPERSLRFHMSASVLVNGLTLVYHILVPLSKNPRGVIIDFIGQNYQPSRLHLVGVDLAVAFLQALMVVLAYEVSHYGAEADFDDDSPLDEDQSEGEASSPAAEEYDGQGHSYDARAGTYDTAASSSMSTYRETPVINFHLRPTLHRVLHDGPVPVIMANGDASSSQTATTLSRIRGIRARIRHRQRGLGQGAEEGEARLDEESDEEREVGLEEASGAPLLPDGQRPNR